MLFWVEVTPLQHPKGLKKKRVILRNIQYFGVHGDDLSQGRPTVL